MKLTKEKLNSFDPCEDGYRWYIEQGTDDFFEICERLKNEKKIDDLNWILTRMMTKSQAVEYAIFAAERWIDIYETRYPDDTRPRAAINAALKWLKKPTNENAAARAARAARTAAAAAAWSAARAARAARAAAWSAAAAAAHKKELLTICNHGIDILKKKGNL